MDPLFQIPEDIQALSAEETLEFIDATVARLDEVAGSAVTFVNAERDSAALRAEMQAAVEAVREAREHLASFEAEEPEAEEAAEVEADESSDELAAELAELAAEAHAEPEAEEAAPVVEAIVEPETVEPITASTTPPVRRTRPARAPSAAPQEMQVPRVALVAAGGSDVPVGQELDTREIAEAMIRRQRNFTGIMPEGQIEKYVIARADWRGLYPEEFTLTGKDVATQTDLIREATRESIIRGTFESRRKEGSLTASGGLCAPRTPYYGLQMISGTERPVRAALPSFNADRGGINAAAPASLADITTAVGQMTAAQDAAGGTSGTKTCQVVDCPDFDETDIEVLFHCLQFGNLGARTFPELLAQWNQLTLSAHARLGERALLTGIDLASTAVTAASLGLGAAADLLGEFLTAAAGMRSRHRMRSDAVLRLLAPSWILDLLTSDTYRSQFDRFDMTPAQFVALIRAANIEPTFYIDSAAGKSQEFAAQTAGVLLPFPSTVTWYLYPEGSFLYLDGGTLELGLVRDSTLNATNDFQIFGESFENVAFVGVESLAVTSTVCDNGVTAGTHVNPCPITYAETS